MPSDARIAPAAPARKPVGLLIAASLGCALLAPVAYLSLIDLAWVRSSAMPLFGLLALSLLLTGLALRRARPWWAVAIGVVNFAIAGFFTFAMTFGTVVPAATTPVGERFDDLIATDHSGQTLRLADALAKGPVLLVFYRGHW